MLLECTECELPYYNWEDLEEHYEVTHPKIHAENNRLDVRIVKRLLNRHIKTYRCPLCFRPFPDPELRDCHVELSECDPEDDSDCERDSCPPESSAGRRRRSLDSILSKVPTVRKRRGSGSSSSSSRKSC
ncbi:hypothetical protein B0H11DRAFT_1909258 [Mycena galericulata]|nr:hypothetical protein B0H11DRAFT_1909258 [Mycena galericulata]